MSIRDVERRERDMRLPTRMPTITILVALVLVAAAVFYVKGTYMTPHGLSAPVTSQDGTNQGKPMANPVSPAPQAP